MKKSKLFLSLLTLCMLFSCGNSTNSSSSEKASSSEESSSIYPIIIKHEYKFTIANHEFKYTIDYEEYEPYEGGFNNSYTIKFYMDGKEFEEAQVSGTVVDDSIIDSNGLCYKIENGEFTLENFKGGGPLYGYELYAGTYELMPDSTHLEGVKQDDKLVLKEDGTFEFLEKTGDYYPLTGNKVVLLDDEQDGYVVDVYSYINDEYVKRYLPIGNNLKVTFNGPVDIDSYYKTQFGDYKRYDGTGYFTDYYLYVIEDAFYVQGAQWSSGKSKVENNKLYVLDGEGNKLGALILNEEGETLTFDSEIEKQIKKENGYINYYVDDTVFVNIEGVCYGQYLKVRNSVPSNVIAVWDFSNNRVLVFNEDLTEYYEIEGSQYKELTE